MPAKPVHSVAGLTVVVDLERGLFFAAAFGVINTHCR
jgi:hypothetical protein